MAKLKDLFKEQEGIKLSSLKVLRNNYKANKEFYTKVLAAIPEELKCSFMLDNYSLDVSLAGTKDDLVQLVRILRKLGIKPDSRPKADAIFWSTYWRSKENYDCQVYVSFSSSECRRVQIGTKIVEQSICETQCDGGDMSDLADEVA